MLPQASEEKLTFAQEELAGNRTHQTGLEAQIQQLQVSQSSLEQELEKLNQEVHQREQTLKDWRKQQVRATQNLCVYVCVCF